MISSRAIALSSPACLAAVATANDPVPYIPAKHHLLLDRYLVDVEQRRIQILIVSYPVQHGKTTLGSHWFGVWNLGLHSDESVLSLSYATQFAETMIGMPSRNLMERFGQRFFGLSVDPTSHARGQWNIAGHRGQFVAKGRGAGVAGIPAHKVIIDDPIATIEDAESAATREDVWRWWQFEIAPRLAPNAAVVVNSSRWHEDDFVGRMIAQCEAEGLPYTHVNLPALAECPKCGDCGLDAINQCGHGVRDELGRLPGEALWPEVRSREFLLKQRKRSGARAFDALFQGRPRPAGGAVIKREWFRYYEQIDADTFRLFDADGRAIAQYKTHQCRKFQLVDLASSERSDADFFVDGTLLITPRNELLVLDIFRDHVPGPRQLPVIKALRNKWGAGRIGVEAVQYQMALVQAGVLEGLPIVPIKRGRESKLTRAYVIAARYEMGQVFHPKHAPWLETFEQELLEFPSGKNDDQVDIMSDAGAIVAESLRNASPQGLRM